MGNRYQVLAVGSASEGEEACGAEGESKAGERAAVFENAEYEDDFEPESAAATGLLQKEEEKGMEAGAEVERQHVNDAVPAPSNAVAAVAGATAATATDLSAGKCSCACV